MQQQIDDKLATQLLAGEIHDGSMVKVDVAEGGVEFPGEHLEPDDAERVSVEEPATDGEAVSKSLGHVSAIVADITKALGLKVDVTTDTTTETGAAKAKKKSAKTKRR